MTSSCGYNWSANFRREDVAERLLPLTVRRLNPFVPEAALLREAQERREQVVSAILSDVQKAVRELQSHGDKTFQTRFRMADFADFALKVAPLFGGKQRIEQVLHRLAGQQIAFATEDEPLLGLVDEWLQHNGVTVNWFREVSSPLFASWKRLAEPGRCPGNAGMRSGQVRNGKGTICELYGLTEEGLTAAAFYWTRESAVDCDVGRGCRSSGSLALNN